jgi:hypothetical protein
LFDMGLFLAKFRAHEWKHNMGIMHRTNDSSILTKEATATACLPVLLGTAVKLHLQFKQSGKTGCAWIDWEGCRLATSFAGGGVHTPKPTPSTLTAGPRHELALVAMAGLNSVIGQ